MTRLEEEPVRGREDVCQYDAARAVSGVAAKGARAVSGRCMRGLRVSRWRRRVRCGFDGPARLAQAAVVEEENKERVLHEEGGVGAGEKNLRKVVRHGCGLAAADEARPASARLHLRVWAGSWNVSEVCARSRRGVAEQARAVCGGRGGGARAGRFRCAAVPPASRLGVLGLVGG